MKSKELFTNPPKKYSPRKIQHKYTDDHKDLLDSIENEGYHGLVTNVPFNDGFTSNKNNIRAFSEFLDSIKSRRLPYWIYDEHGYPSGKADTLVIEGHPEFKSKGMFMYKRMVFEKTRAKYHLPDEADKIVYAVKYPFFDTSGGGRVDYSRPTELSFDIDYLECDLDVREALYVFAVKTTHEGTHSMHNANSQRFNINIMDKRAVRRFIDVAFEPIAEIEGAYEGAEAVFTDEPSLFVTYNAMDTAYNFAVCPYADGMFEYFYELYGERLEPKLPLIFEGGKAAYPIRIKFYELVGKMISEAYSGQINEWCEAHGTKFSGHYLGEDEPYAHVAYYGNYLKVVSAAGYPGFDILSCFPEIFKYINDKVPEMVARKTASSGLMVELCPFDKKSEFDKAPFDNMKCVTALCYLHGARVSNSYFQLREEERTPENIAKMREFNKYTARLGYMLDGLVPDTNIFVYYPIENNQSRLVPEHSRAASATEKARQHDSIEKITSSLEHSGFNPLFVDKEDIVNAYDSFVKCGIPSISELKVKTVIVPEIEVIDENALSSLKALSENGVRVFFVDGVPSVSANSGEYIECGFEKTEICEVLKMLHSDGEILTDEANGKVIRGKFRDGDGMLHLLVNTARADTKIGYDAASPGEIFDLDSGNVTTVLPGEKIRIPAMRGIFIKI